MFVPESLRKQNELIRTLRKELEAKERELADTRWVFDQYLQSPSWRITAPLRWLARVFRSIKHALLGTTEAPSVPEVKAAEPEVQEEATSDKAVNDLKGLYTSLYQTQLQTFLTSGALLDLPTTPEPEVSIILVLFNRAELTLQCLRSIREDSAETLEVIIVDNASSDETAKLLDRIRGANIIRNSENRNFLLAVNQAAAEARGRYLLLLNNDAQLMPGSLRAALETIKTEPNGGAVGGRIVLLDGSLQEAGSIVWRDGSCLGYGRGDNPFAPAYMFRRDVDYCSGAFLITPRETWQTLGGFDTAFAPAYYEETDYCTRLWEHGLRVIYEPSAVVTHYEFASSGSARAATELQSAHQKIFAARHREPLQNHAAAGADAILGARMHSNRRRVLFIDDRVPHPWLGSGFPRARTMLMTLRQLGYFITFYPGTILNEEWPDVYSDLPRDIEVINGFGPPLLEAFLRTRRGYYDAIIVSRPHNMAYLKPILEAHREWFTSTKVIYDAEALFAPRDVALRQLRGEVLTNEEIEKVYRAEIDLAAGVDCVAAVSDPDRLAFQKHGVTNVKILGHLLKADPLPQPFAARRGFLFIGAIHEEASPNGDSMIWFLTEIWPQIRAALGDAAILTIAGVNKSERIRTLAGSEVRLMGHLEDVTELYSQARVFIAPTRFAAGIPHKVHEAAARGIPVVATAVLGRQLGWTDGVECAIVDDATTFASRCVALHQDETKWSRIRSTALDAIRRECALDTFENQMQQILSSLTSSEARYADARMDR